MIKPIKCAVIGLGGMGGTHVEAAKESTYISGIIGYEPNLDRAKKRGNELGIEATNNLDSIMNDKEIKLVYIASINEVHCEQTIKSLEAGKAVLVEKPLGINLEEAYKTIEVKQKTNGFLQVGFELHYSKLYQTVKDWIDTGLIGKTLNSNCTYLCSEFHLRDSWRSKSKGTLVGEKLSHYLDAPLWWFNEPIEDVYAVSAPNFVNYFNHPDNHQITCRFKSGAISTLNFVMGIAESDEGDPLLDLLDKQSDDGHALKYIIYGTKGAIETDVFRRRIRRWKFNDSVKKLESKLVETIVFDKSEDQEWFHNVHKQNLRIAELVAKNLPPDTPPEDSLETMKLCFAVEKSTKEKKVIKINEV